MADLDRSPWSATNPLEIAMQTRALRATALGILALAPIAGGFGGGACAADIIRYGIDDDQNINRLPQVVAEREGFFAREGVEVQIVIPSRGLVIVRVLPFRSANVLMSGRATTK